MQKMCEECPFSGHPKYSTHKVGWLEHLEKNGFNKHPHGCHLKNDSLNPNPGEECVGHALHLMNQQETS